MVAICKNQLLLYEEEEENNNDELQLEMMMVQKINVSFTYYIERIMLIVSDFI